MSELVIQNATQGNLRGVTLAIPKEKLVVFTGLSGSGKSTLLIDVLFQECQRQYLEAMGMQGIRKPQVDRVRGASPAVLITQSDQNKNPRSTVGTVSDLYTDLRMVYEKLSVRTCPGCGRPISSADCEEQTEREGDEFRVFMICHLCGHRMRKLTRSEFSFNTRQGACPTCQGLGSTLSVRLESVLREELSLEQGAVAFWEAKFGEYQTGVYYRALRHFGIPEPRDIAVSQFDKLQRAILMEGVTCDAVRETFPDAAPPKTAAAGRFEGVVPMLWKRLRDHGGDLARLGAYFHSVVCSDCGGEQLCELSRSVTVEQTRLPELSVRSLEELRQWVDALAEKLDGKRSDMVGDYLLDLRTKLDRFLQVGLGYLTLDRQTTTLSGGELQRMRLAAVLDSDLSGVIYILDEPTVGLHPKDTAGLVAVLKRLRDKGNTVLVIEHDPDVMRQADWIVDIGPGSGLRGGRVVTTGTPEEICRSPESATGCYLGATHPGKTVFRQPSGTAVRVSGAHKFNLKGFDVAIPAGCLSAVTGPSGSGKSTLVFELIAKGDHRGPDGAVSGCGQFDALVEIGQAPLARMKRSNVATYCGAYAPIRTLFAGTPQAVSRGLGARHFSFNTTGGRCETCQGLGVVTSNLLFFQDVEVVCPACGGRQFSDEVLDVKYRGHSIHDVMKLSVEAAAELFADRRPIAEILNLLMEVGLGYLELGQTLPTLSGGEGQRLKLARELIGSRGRKRNLYLLDEPTTGLHPVDVEHFLRLLDKLVDAGSTVVVVEHNEQLIRHCDCVVDLGPGGGERGGELMFTGTPAQMQEAVGDTARVFFGNH
ncbi:excinuclease ABC subunit UvrA [Feifania hominis]|uniref:UvrABC system protein A n=1 Tax=Feifania hominis TaxID=2763660 RepID=A0A926HUD2_9FIRM|nr:excinuclease ABC subunit UvrA [Feifania hominis]MBC8535431.1 excinuclease ABC subunit UvrA [Feifania hominis]